MPESSSEVRLASDDAQYKQLMADLRLAQKNEREYLFAQAPEIKQAWEAFAAPNQAKAKTKTAAGKKLRDSAAGEHPTARRQPRCRTRRSAGAIRSRSRSTGKK